MLSGLFKQSHFGHFLPFLLSLPKGLWSLDRAQFFEATEARSIILMHFLLSCQTEIFMMKFYFLFDDCGDTKHTMQGADGLFIGMTYVQHMFFFLGSL